MRGMELDALPGHVVHAQITVDEPETTTDGCVSLHVAIDGKAVTITCSEPEQWSQIAKAVGDGIAAMYGIEQARGVIALAKDVVADAEGFLG